MSRTPDKAVRPEVEQLYVLRERLASSVASATDTFLDLTYPALAAVLPIEHILQTMQIDAASDSFNEVTAVRVKMTALNLLMDDLIDEFEAVANAGYKEEVDKIWSNALAQARKIPDWYYSGELVD